VRRGNDAAGDQVDDEEPADSDPTPRVWLCKTGHSYLRFSFVTLKRLSERSRYASLATTLALNRDPPDGSATVSM
jgi:hypothetical protein